MKIIDINGSEREVKSVAPDPSYPGYVRVEFRRHHEWYTITEFLQFNPDLKHLTANAPALPEEIVGKVTSSSKDSLSDSNKDLKPNTYVGWYIWISRGKGEGQRRTITKNSKSKFTVDKPWDIKPDTTSQYVLSFNVKETKAMGNTFASDDQKALERLAHEMDHKRGKINREFKYLKPEEL